MISKTDRQTKGIVLWTTNKARGTLNYVPRFGKTRVIQRVCENSKAHNKNVSITLLSPNLAGYNNLDNIAYELGLQNYTRRTLSNLINDYDYMIYSCDILIVDEIHDFLDPVGIQLLRSIKYNWILGLTGSSLTDKQIKLLSHLGCPVIDTIEEEEAIANGWIVDYDEYNVPIKLDSAEIVKYSQIEDILSKCLEQFDGVYRTYNRNVGFRMFEGNFDFISSLYIGYRCRDFDAPYGYGTFIPADEISNNISKWMGFNRNLITDDESLSHYNIIWSPDNVSELAKTYIMTIKSRNDFLKCCSSKLVVALGIMDELKVPTMVFSESTEMIDLLYEQRESVSVRYHSQLKSTTMRDDNGDLILYKSGKRAGEPKQFGLITQKAVALEEIEQGKKQFLICGKSLTQSINLPMIGCVLILSGDTNTSTHEQKSSRTKTVNELDKDKKALVINLFIEDIEVGNTIYSSRDKIKLLQRQRNVNNVIWLNNSDEIFDILRNK